MNCRYLYEHVLNAYKTYDITTFPINCFEIIRKQGFQIIKYSDLNRAKKEACRELSNDACLIEGKLYYDENAHPRRIAFSVAHELGHLFLDTDSEDEADEFASHFLAPRILIHKYGYRTSVEIHDAFGLSYAASNRALFSYREWLWNISRSRPRSPSESELQLEKIFFPSEIEKLPEPVIEEDEQEERPLDPTEKYLMILGIIQMGIPVPPEYKKDVQWYKRHGFRLK